MQTKKDKTKKSKVYKMAISDFLNFAFFDSKNFKKYFFLEK